MGPIVKLITSKISAIFFVVVLCIGLVLGSDFFLYLNLDPYLVELETSDQVKFMALLHTPTPPEDRATGVLIYKGSSEKDLYDGTWYRRRLNFKFLPEEKIVIADRRGSSIENTKTIFDLDKGKHYNQRMLPDSLRQRIVKLVDLDQKITTADTKPLMQKIGYFRWRLLLHQFY